MEGRWADRILLVEQILEIREEIVLAVVSESLTWMMRWMVTGSILGNPGYRRKKDF